MKRLILLVIGTTIAGCASTPQGLATTRVEKTIISSKTPQEFATCAAESLAGEVQLRGAGEHYWVLRYALGSPRHRWDFTAKDGQTIAELRSTGLAGSGENSVRGCA